MKSKKINAKEFEFKNHASHYKKRVQKTFVSARGKKEKNGQKICEKHFLMA